MKMSLNIIVAVAISLSSATTHAWPSSSTDHNKMAIIETIDLIINPGQRLISELASAAFRTLRAVPDVLLQVDHGSRGVADSRGPKEVDQTVTGAIRQSLFGSISISFRGLPAAKRWDLARTSGMDGFLGVCGDAQPCTESQKTIGEAVRQATDLRFVEKLRAINTAVNKSIGYASDTAIYGTTDHWANATETMRLQRGDCEDFAILKMAALKAAGVPEKSMTLVVLSDTRRKLYHAVLAVSTDQGHFILDNVHDRILKDTAIRHYRPLYSLSGERSWIHGYSRKDAGQIAGIDSMNSVAPGNGP